MTKLSTAHTVKASKQVHMKSLLSSLIKAEVLTQDITSDGLIKLQVFN